MSGIAEKWNAFCEWQQRPYQIAKKSEEHHRCCACGEEFQGNYCPSCGQSARTGRYSFKIALKKFIDDVWEMGNRSLLRTLRDLILRPGYLIRDYISGMQRAYFPPFKLLFVLTAVLLVVQSGVNLKRENYLASYYEQTINRNNPNAERDQDGSNLMTNEWLHFWYISGFVNGLACVKIVANYVSPQA